MSEQKEKDQEAEQKRQLIDLMKQQKKLEIREKELVEQYTGLKAENEMLKAQAGKIESKDDENSMKGSFATPQKYDIPERMALREPENPREFYRPLRCIKK